MREVTEKRTCDRCKKGILKDTDEWIGAQIVVTGIIVGDNRLDAWKNEHDLCIACVREFEAWMKNAT